MVQSRFYIITCIVFLSGCSALADSIAKSRGNYTGDHLGETMRFRSTYYTERIFRNPEFKGERANLLSIKSYSYNEINKKGSHFYKYYYSNNDDNAMELPAAQMWQSKRKGKHFFPRLTIGYSEPISTREDRNNLNRFRDSYTYQKKNGQYVKFEYMDAYSTFEKKRIPVQYCQSDGWCKTYIHPVDFLNYSGENVIGPDCILYELDNALYVKRSDIYPPWEAEVPDDK